MREPSFWHTVQLKPAHPGGHRHRRMHQHAWQVLSLADPSLHDMFIALYGTTPPDAPPAVLPLMQPPLPLLPLLPLLQLVVALLFGPRPPPPPDVPVVGTVAQ